MRGQSIFNHSRSLNSVFCISFIQYAVSGYRHDDARQIPCPVTINNLHVICADAIESMADYGTILSNNERDHYWRRDIRSFIGILSS